MFHINICRICSSRGSYDIFDVIPAYLHYSPKEYRLWTKDISVLIEETTGLRVQPNDKLPNKICALCISYLKHASTFRQQAIENYLSLRTVTEILISESQTTENNARNTNPNHCQKNNAATSSLAAAEAEGGAAAQNFKDESFTINNLDRFINLLFNKDPNEPIVPANCSQKLKDKFNYIDDDAMFIQDFQLNLNDDEHLTKCYTKDNNHGDQPLLVDADVNSKEKVDNDYLNYKEKNFEEDDILDLLDELHVSINIPETYKERKCPSCFQRFMFSDTYDDHIDICIENHLDKMIEGINRLHELRVYRLISPFEFIRRMFFSLRKITKWIDTFGFLPKERTKVDVFSESVYGAKLNEKNNIMIDTKKHKYQSEIDRRKRYLSKLILTNSRANRIYSKSIFDTKDTSDKKHKSSGKQNKSKNINKKSNTKQFHNSKNDEVLMTLSFPPLPPLTEDNSKIDEHDKIIALFEED